MPRRKTKEKSVEDLFAETRTLLDAAIAIGDFVSARTLLANVETLFEMMKEGK